MATGLLRRCTPSDMRNYDGSMLIDVIDAKTNKMIWTGNASAEVYKDQKNAEVMSG